MALTLHCIFISFATVLCADNVYLQSGIPATDREWNGSDYQTAFTILNLAKVPKPSLDSSDGRKLLKRLTDTSNFKFNKNQSIPVGVRLNDYLQLQQGLTSILKLYLITGDQQKAFHSEIAQLMGFSLKAWAIGIELVNEIVPTIPKDANYQIKMAGVAQMHAGLTTSFSGVEFSLHETELYSEEDRLVLLSAMNSVLPVFKQVFPVNYNTELMNRLEKHLDVFQGDGVQMVESMIATLKPVEERAFPALLSSPVR